MSCHTILAPSPRDARNLVEVLDALGYQARFTTRHTKRGRKTVVLAVAPIGIINKACERASFGAL